MRGDIFLLLLCCISLTVAIYEDEIGVNNWIIKNIGKVKTAKFGNEEILVITDKNIVASLSQSQGSLLWRQQVDAPLEEVILLTAQESVITCTSQHIYNWRKSDGGLLWVSALDYTQPSSPSSSSSNDDDIFQVIMMKSNVLVIHHNSLSLYNLETGNREWYSRRDHGQILGVTKDNNQKLISISLMNHILGFTKLDMERGKSHHEVHSLPLHVRHGGHHDSHSSSTHPFIYSFSDNFFAYVDQNAILILDIHLFLNVHHIPLSEIGCENGIKSLKMITERDDVSKIRLMIITETSSRMILWWHNGDLKMTPLIPSSSSPRFIDNFAYGGDDFTSTPPSSTPECYLISQSLSSSSTNDEGVQLQIYQIKGEGEMISTSLLITTNDDDNNNNDIHPRLRGNIDQIICKDNMQKGRCILLTDDFTLFFMSNQQIKWKREEALSALSSLYIIDAPSPLTPLERMLRKTSVNVLDHFIHRIEGEILYLIDRLTSDHEYDQDTFGFHKILIAITDHSKIYALSSSLSPSSSSSPSSPSPMIKWHIYLPNQIIHSFKCLNTDEHSCYFFTKHTETKESMYYTINVLSGEYQRHVLSVDVHHPIIILNNDDNNNDESDATNNNPSFLLVDPSLHIHDYNTKSSSGGGDDDKQIRIPNHVYYYYQIDSKMNVIEGYAINDQKKLNLIWQLVIPEYESILKVAEPISGDVIFSPIRIFGFNATEKYLNPNLLAVATSYHREETENIIVYIIDTISGQIIHRTHVEDASSPLQLLLCENFIVFTYRNTKTLRNQLTVIDLLRPEIDWSNSDFSSFDVSNQHIRIHQLTFELSFEVTALSVTSTLRGITGRNILLGSSSNQLIGLDRRIIDGLRYKPKKDEEPIEGIIPYWKYIQPHDRAFLSYTLEILNLKGITSAPTDLESTSVVVAYGLDIFYTHTHPSDQFDILSIDFDRYSLLIIVTLLTFFTILTSRMANSKDLSKKWA